MTQQGKGKNSLTGEPHSTQANPLARSANPASHTLHTTREYTLQNAWNTAICKSSNIQNTIFLCRMT
eukprot:m.14740 g.14740  ORF g.14740 m.14740 type:complete len:67 (-) comp6421_c0_seq1:61-261(-)